MDEETRNYIDFMNYTLSNSDNYQKDKNKFMSLLEKGITGGIQGVNGYNISSKISSGLTEAKTLKDSLNTTSKLAGATSSSSVGGFLKGASNSLGGLTGVGNLVVSGANLIPGVKSDYNDTFGKVVDVGATAAGLGSVLGIAGLGPIGFGLASAALINNVAGRKANKLDIGRESLINTGSGYSGIANDLATAGKKTTLTGNLFGYKGTRTNTINKKVEKLESNRAMASMIGESNKLNMLGASNSIQDTINKNKQVLSGGLNTRVLSARKGGKMNVIPSGALHARKHNLPKEISEQVTNKGIPVVSYGKNGEILQHAEIEHSEIILHKELTNKLEELLKKYDNGDESVAIEAGKLLTYEILENTNDNTGLLNG